MGFIPFPRVLVLCEMQSVSSRVWTCVAVSISYDDNHYTTGTSIKQDKSGKYSWEKYEPTSPPSYGFVAERISHFCLARNLIRPLDSTHIFNQSGWFVLIHLDYLSGQHKLGKSTKHFLFVELLRSVQTSYSLLSNSSSSIDTMREAVWFMDPCVYFSSTKGSQLNMN